MHRLSLELRAEAPALLRHGLHPLGSGVPVQDHWYTPILVGIDKAVPDQLDVYLVCDNLSTHKTPAINDWLARHPRFHMHFTPTGSSWINQVERWFAFLTDQLLRRGVHKSVQALEKDVREWINNWNKNPRPFVWKKTAEEILESLARYIARISGGGH
ncbi:transposase [Actinopolymorpha sp. B11F2]|uniref:transposase n=1 Tax=Actinopolymorpha sp. B11F2 TaxID=3160862 RepID=UPI0032E4C1EC